MMKSVEYFIETRGNFCENCSFPFTRYNTPDRHAERHHAIIKRKKGNAALDEEINIELVCHKCHASGIVDSFEHRQEFAMRQINRGYDVKAWIESLNLKYIEDWLLRL